MKTKSQILNLYSSVILAVAVCLGTAPVSVLAAQGEMSSSVFGFFAKSGGSKSKAKSAYTSKCSSSKSWGSKGSSGSKSWGSKGSGKGGKGSYGSKGSGSKGSGSKGWGSWGSKGSGSKGSGSKGWGSWGSKGSGSKGSGSKGWGSWGSKGSGSKGSGKGSNCSDGSKGSGSKGWGSWGSKGSGSKGSGSKGWGSWGSKGSGSKGSGSKGSCDDGDPVNVAPVVENLDYVTAVNVPVDVIPVGTDADGDVISYHIIDQPANGIVLEIAEGDWIYIPAPGFSGTDTFTYGANDGVLESAAGTVTIVIEIVNVPPTADDLSVSTSVDVPVNITLSGADADGDSITYSVLTEPANGSLFQLSETEFMYIPNGGFVGLDSFTYATNDGQVYSETATVSIEVVSSNFAPTADDKSYEIFIDGQLSGQLTGSDPESDPLAFAIIDYPAYGAVFELGGGSFIYLPDGIFTGTVTFTYVANDGLQDSPVATVTISILSPNQPPLAEDQSVETPMDTAVQISLIGSDPDGDAITFVIVDYPSNGSVFELGAGELFYIPDGGFAGTDTFTFITNDGEFDSDLATVTVTVLSPSNNAPTADDKSYVAAPNESVVIDLSGSDPDGDTITYTIVDQPLNGSLFALSATQYYYIPESNFIGTDTFTYVTNDGQLNSATATVSILIETDGNLPPVVDAGPDVTYLIPDVVQSGGEAVIPLDGSASDDDLPVGAGLTVIWTLVSAPSGSNVTLDDPFSPTGTFTVANPIEGDYTFEISASDSVFTVYDEVTISLVPGNQPPVVVTDLTMEVDVLDTYVTINGSVTDDGLPFGAPLTAQWTVIDGPGFVGIDDPTSPTTQANFSAPGIYILELTGDDTEFVASEVLIVYVNITCLIQIPDNAVAWWTGKFAFTDFVNRLHDGIDMGGVSYVDGVVSLAYGFDGIDDGIFALGTSASDVGGANGFTIEGWFRPDVLANMPIFEWNDGTTPGVAVSVGSNGELNVSMPNNSNIPVNVSFPGVFSAGQYRHIALNYRRALGTLEVYVDSVLVGSQTVGTLRVKTGSDIWIGMSPDGTPEYYAGAIDELTLYAGALTQGQIIGIFLSNDVGKCPFPDNL